MKTLEEEAEEYSYAISQEDFYSPYPSINSEDIENAFIAGANWQKEQSQWHDLRKNPDDLPEIDESVLVKVKYDSIVITKIAIISDDDAWYSNDGSCFLKSSKLYKVIAWMPIPEFKEEK